MTDTPKSHDILMVIQAMVGNPEAVTMEHALQVLAEAAVLIDKLQMLVGMPTLSTATD